MNTTFSCVKKIKLINFYVHKKREREVGNDEEKEIKDAKTNI